MNFHPFIGLLLLAGIWLQSLTIIPKNYISANRLASNYPASISPFTSGKKSAAGGLSVEIVDITPKFLRFYDSARSQPLDSESRWLLWKKMYGFAAVQPGPKGEQMARVLLDNAWPKYPSVITRIRQGASVLKPAPLTILKRVADILKADVQHDSIKVKLTVYVGGLENNAFAYTDHGIPAVAIPVETDDKDLELTMTHEFTHAVHLKTAPGLLGGKSSDVATLVLREGLAMRVTEKLVPGERPQAYTNAHSDTWLQVADGRQVAILKGIQLHLRDTAADSLSKFIYGKGTTGLNREAYYAGWVIVGQLEKQGLTLADVGQLPTNSIAELLDTTINTIVKKKD